MELFILLLFSSLHFANCLVAISQNYECDDCEFEPYLNHTSCVCGFDGKTYSGPCDAICNGKTVKTVAKFIYSIVYIKVSIKRWPP